MRAIERVIGIEMPDVLAELTVRRDQARQLWKDAWERRERSSTTALFGNMRVGAARVAADQLESDVEEVLYALGGSREHDDAPSG